MSLLDSHLRAALHSNSHDDEQMQLAKIAILFQGQALGIVQKISLA